MQVGQALANTIIITHRRGVHIVCPGEFLNLEKSGQTILQFVYERQAKPVDLVEPPRLRIEFGAKAHKNRSGINRHPSRDGPLVLKRSPLGVICCRRVARAGVMRRFPVIKPVMK
jgi:hypothetical protein